MRIILILKIVTDILQNIATCYGILSGVFEVAQFKFSTNLNMENIVESVKLALATEENLTNSEIVLGEESKKGDGVIAVINRFIFAGTDSKNNIRSRHLILKTAPVHEIYRTSSPIHEMYENEIYAYETVLPTLRKINEEFGLKFVNYPICYRTNLEENREYLVLEDLNTRDFKLWDKRKTMDDDHLHLVLENLAKFHAASICIKKKRLDVWEKLTADLNGAWKTFFGRTEFCDAIIDMAKTLDFLFEDKEDVLERFKMFRDTEMKEFLRDFCNRIDSDSVIVHGDLWSNNILFRYEDQSHPDKPTDMALLDFQAIRLSSIAVDVSYFLYISASKQSMSTIETYLDYYYGKLAENLLKMDLDPDLVSPRSSLFCQWKRYNKFGLAMALVTLHGINSDSDEYPSLEELVECGKDFWFALNFKSRNESRYQERIKDVILHFIEKDYIGKLGPWRSIYSGGSGVTPPPPRFLTRGNTFRVVRGDTVTLPCEVQNLGTFVIVWRKGTVLLSAGQQKISQDDRVSLIHYNLQIRDIGHPDEGDYTCQIGDGSMGDLIHTIEILMPPSIQIIPPNGQITTRKGGPVSFECRANGNPPPTVQWSKKDGILPSGIQVQNGPLLSLVDVQRQHAGVYQCTASNGIGQPVTSDIKLNVLYPPEATVVRSWTNTGEGLEAKLDCLVHSDPPAEVTWYQDSFLLQPTDRRLMSQNGQTHSLTIRNIQLSDFGNYSCLVANSIGREKKYIELSGKPGPPIVVSPGYSDPTEYNLSWSVQSVFPILEVRILYRRILINASFHHPGQWHDVLVRPKQTYNSATSERRQSYAIRNLIPDSVYECLIQTKNQHGYGELSDLHQWFSSQKGRPLIRLNSGFKTTGTVWCPLVFATILIVF